MRFLIPLAAALTLAGAVALAQDAPPPGGGPGRHWHMDPAKMAAHHKQMCLDRYARMVGGMASLETELDLTGAEKPLFVHWKDDVLSSAKSASEHCAAMTPPKERPSLIDGMKMHERMLAERLAALRAQEPALEALYAGLTADQQKVLTRGIMRAMHAMHGGMHGMHGPMGPHGMDDMDRGPDGPH